jgi:hypothetical protein
MICALAFAQNNQSKSSPKGAAAKVEITEAPAYDCGGVDKLDSIAGKVTGVRGDYRVVIYAHACNGVLYVQPTIAAPFTRIAEDGSFDAYIHLGHTYYVLLVTPDYKPKPELSQVPAVGGDVLAVGRIRARGGNGEGAKKN